MFINRNHLPLYFDFAYWIHYEIYYGIYYGIYMHTNARIGARVLNPYRQMQPVQVEHDGHTRALTVLQPQEVVSIPLEASGSQAQSNPPLLIYKWIWGMKV